MGFIGVQPTSVPLTSSDITDGIISTAKIADDAVGNTKLDLGADYAFTGSITGAGGGKVLQTVRFTQYTGTFSQSLTANTNTVIGSSALTVNITPTSASSTIRLDCHVFHEWGSQGDATNSVWFFYKDTTALKGASGGSRPVGISMSTISNIGNDAGSTPEIAYYSYFDAPNTTSQITYKIGLLPRYDRTLYVNRTVDDTDAIGYERGISFISATEIGA